jgi:uncharacterized protein (TIGR03083 family)
MDDAALREHLETESRRVTMLDPSTVAAPVPWCGEWSVGSVVGHLSGIQRWATALVRHPDERIKRREMEQPPSGTEVFRWYAQGIEPMLAVFDSGDLDTTVNTWAGLRPSRWWLRRLAHETAVHRWDAEAGSIGPEAAVPLEPALAVDGIDELLDNFLPLVDAELAGTGQTMHLHATDAPGEWQLTFAPNGVQVERAHAKGDVAVRGPASALLLLLWNRPRVAAAPTEVFGDPAVLDVWSSAARL